MTNQHKIWTILDVIDWGRDFFTKKRIESPRLNIELLLCHALSLSRLALYSRFDQPLNNSELESIREMVLRRAKNEPIQYIAGKTEFYGLELEVDRNVLIPRPETEELVDFIVRSYSGEQPPQDVLDIGSGSGCIAIALAKAFPDATVAGIDVSKPAIEIAKRNAEKNSATNVEFYKYDILSAVPKKKFDLVVSNPPYIPRAEMAELATDVAEYEPHEALTDGGDGLAFYRRFADIFPDIISAGGSFFLEIGFGEAEAILKLFAQKLITAHIKKDMNGIDRFVFGKIDY